MHSCISAAQGVEHMIDWNADMRITLAFHPSVIQAIGARARGVFVDGCKTAQCLGSFHSTVVVKGQRKDKRGEVRTPPSPPPIFVVWVLPYI